MRAGLLVFVAVIACGEVDDFDSVADDGAIRDSSPQGSDASTEAADASVSEQPVTFHIEFDYRFDDSGFFVDPDRRATLELAADAWGRIFDQDYFTIQEGTQVRTRDPEAPDSGGLAFAIDRDIDDLLIFVGCANLDGAGGNTARSNHTAALNAVEFINNDPELAEKLRDRYNGADFQPWTGWISFDCEESWYFDLDISTHDDIPATDNDFWSVAMHEIGHVLGFGTAEAFFQLREEAPMRFVGPTAQAEYGGPVPLAPTGVHLESGILSDSALLDPSHPSGVRTPPIPLDIAVLVDIGHDPAL